MPEERRMGHRLGLVYPKPMTFVSQIYPKMQPTKMVLMRESRAMQNHTFYSCISRGICQRNLAKCLEVKGIPNKTYAKYNALHWSSRAR